jgi:hypothetical protein
VSSSWAILRSLLRKGVLKEDRPVETLFAPDNMDRAKLEVGKPSH